MTGFTARRTSVRLDNALDHAVLAYADWRDASSAVWDAYGRWDSATDADHHCAHAAYLATLDQEQAAANAYAERIGRVVFLLSTENAPLASTPST